MENETQISTEPVLEAILENQDSNLKDVNQSLEHILTNQDEKISDTNTILEHSLVKQDEIVKAIKQQPEVQKIKIVTDESDLADNFFRMLRGQKGYTPEKGKDYFTDSEVKEWETKVTPVKGKDYFTEKEIGQFKKDITPIKGKEYFTDSEISSFKKEITPVKGKDYVDGKDGYTPKKGKDYVDGKDGYTPVKGVDYFDGEAGKPGKDGKDLSKETIAKLEKVLLKKDSNLLFANTYGVNTVTGVGVDNSDPKNPIINIPEQTSTFIELTDVPQSYSGQGGKGVRVKGTTDGLEFYTTTDSDEKVKYDAADPTAGYVADKIVAGTGISVAEGTGANENKLVITNTISDTDAKVKYNTDDTTAGFLADKTIAGTGITLEEGTGGDADKLKIVNSAPDQTVAISAGTGISTSGTYPNFTVTNSAPDQTVAITGGTGISTGGTYPNLTVTNTAPDQTVSITDSGIATVTGTYPNFNVDVPDQTYTLPTATDSVLGGIKVGATLGIVAGVLNYTNPNPTPYSLPTAAAGTLGGIKVGSRLSIDGSGVLSADVQPGAGDVFGPGVAVDSNFASFDTTTGKLIKDSGKNASSFMAAGSVTQYTDEMAQDAVGNAVGNGLDYDDSTGAISVDESELSLPFLKLDQATPQTVQGLPVFDDGIQFGATPTPGAFGEGKVYYDNVWKTLTANIDGDVSMQIGQEDLRLVYNNSGADILNGKAVYTTGVYNSGTNDVATVGLAKADVYATAQILGLATQNIANNSYGLITVRGHINAIDTNAFTAGDVLYLCDATAGCLTNVEPNSPSLKVRVGRVITKAVSGRVNVRIIPLARVEDLSDYEGTAADGDFLVREGSAWVPKSGAISAGAGVNVYLDNDTSVDDYRSLLRSPDNVTATQTDSVLVNTATVGSTLLIRGFLYNQAENRTKWDGGVWKFNTYAYCSTGTGTNEIIVGVYNVQNFGGTATVTGTGTSRTCTVSGYTGTPFVAGDANANMTLSGYVQTAGGTFQITGYTSEDVVTIATPTGYTNESGVAFTTHKYKFQSSTGDIQQTGSPILYSHSVAQTDITLKDVTDTIAVRYFAKTSSAANRTLYMTYNGATNYSYIETPLTTRHDDLAGLNLTGSNYQHLTSAQKTIATQAASGSQDGYLTSANWTTFNNKQPTLTFGIADTNKVQINAADVADNDYAKFTATGLEGRSYSEVLSDIGAAAAVHTHEGTSVLSTGEVGGTKFLREDGDGTCSWQTVAGGTDEKVKYDVNDPTAGYVADKIVAGTGISVAEGTGATENKLVVTSSITQYTDELAQDAVGGMVDTTLTYTDGTPELKVTNPVTPQATGFTITAGTTAKTLTVADTASVSGTNTGDNATNTQYSGLVTNATHTGEVTGSGALTLDKTAISNKTDTVITASDVILFGDATDTGNLKSDTVQGILDLVTHPSQVEDSITDGHTTIAPSGNSVYDALALKAPTSNPTFTGTVILPKTLEIQDTSADHQYVLAVSELTADRTVTLPLLTGNDEFVFKAHTQTLTNKRITKRVVTTTDDATAVIDVDVTDVYELSAVASPTEFTLTGTPTDGQQLMIRYKDAGTAKGLTFTGFTALGVTIPTTTVISKWGYVGCTYNLAATAWHVIAVGVEA